MIEAFDTLRSGLAVAVACQALGVPRATVYRTGHRRRAIVSRAQPIPRPRPPLTLSDAERETLLTALNSERFADMAPRSIYATLLDEGQYLASVCTMYRVLAAEGQSLERHASPLRQTGAARRSASSGLELGYHQTEGPGALERVSPVRDPGHLQPLRRRLDGGAAGGGGAGRGVHR